MPTLHLYTIFYSEKKPERIKGLFTCLQRNLNKPVLSSVTVFNEGDYLSDFATSKMKVIEIAQRPRYQDFFRYINQHGSNNNIHIIS